MTGSEVFWEGAARHELLLPWCQDCGRSHYYPRSACPFCWSESLTWRVSPGRGVVYTFAVVRSNPPASFQPDVPFTIAVVELDEGVRLLTNIVGPAEALAIGDRVVAEFTERGGRTLPVFRREAAA